MPALSVMIKPASGNCNMHCDYCFYCDEMANRKQHSYGFMTEETLQNVIRKTMFQAEYQITYAFQGGEPTLRGIDFFRKAIAFEKKYNHKHIRVSNVLQTNGYDLNEQWCQFFQENEFLIGVSVDGTRQLHDQYRHGAGSGEPTYDRICENVKRLERYGIEYNILTVVTQSIAQNAGAIYETYKRNGWMYQQYIECLDPLEEEKCTSPYSLQPLTYGKFLTELFDLWYGDFQKGRQPYIRRFENYIRLLAGWRAEACEQCGECGVQVVVEADGSAYPCDFFMLDAYRLGNFNQDRLPQMDLRRREIGFIDRSRNICEECRKCPYYALCRGGCQRSRRLLPDERAYRNRFCEGYRYFFAHCLERMEEIANRIKNNRY